MSLQTVIAAPMPTPMSKKEMARREQAAKLLDRKKDEVMYMSRKDIAEALLERIKTYRKNKNRTLAFDCATLARPFAAGNGLPLEIKAAEAHTMLEAATAHGT